MAKRKQPACEDYHGFYETRCMLIKGHDGRHRGVRDEPKTYWWSDEVGR